MTTPKTKEEINAGRAKDPRFNPWAGRTDENGFLIPNGSGQVQRKPGPWSPLDPIRGYDHDHE